MNKIVSILALTFALVLGAKAQSIIIDVPMTTAWDCVGTNFTFTANTTNAAPVTNLVVTASQGLHHAFHIYSTSNAFNVFLDKTIDGSTWATNNVIAIAANQVFETNITQKIMSYRIRSYGSNTVGGVNYLGGR